MTMIRKTEDASVDKTLSREVSFLFPRPSFVEGVARLADLSGMALSHYNWAPTPEAADRWAIAADWKAVTNELRAAVERFHAGDQPPEG